MHDMIARSSGGRPAIESSARGIIGLLSVICVALIFGLYQSLIKDSVIDNGGRQQWWHLAPAWFVSAPYAVTALLMLRRGSYGTYLFAQLQAAVGLAASIPLSMLFLLGAGLSMGDDDPVVAASMMAGFTIVQVAILAVAYSARRSLASTLPPEGYSGAAGWVPILLAIIAVAGASAMSSQDEVLRKDYWNESTKAKRMLAQATMCAIAWRQEHGSYPEALEAVIANGCLPDQMRSGAYAEHAFRYQRDAAIGFALLAEPDQQLTKDNLSHLSDASGRIYRLIEASGPNREYAALHLEDHVQASLLSVVKCVVKHGETHDGEFPALIGEMNGCLSALNTLFGYHDSIDIAHWPYHLRYLPKPGADGRRSGFEIEVRPRQYGAAAIRSYWVDQTQVVHGTGENRAATADDPEILKCELTWGYVPNCEDDFERRGTPLEPLLERLRAAATK